MSAFQWIEKTPRILLPEGQKDWLGQPFCNSGTVSPTTCYPVSLYPFLPHSRTFYFQNSLNVWRFWSKFNIMQPQKLLGKASAHARSDEWSAADIRSEAINCIYRITTESQAATALPNDAVGSSSSSSSVPVLTVQLFTLPLCSPLKLSLYIVMRRWIQLPNAKSYELVKFNRELYCTLAVAIQYGGTRQTASVKCVVVDYQDTGDAEEDNIIMCV